MNETDTFLLAMQRDWAILDRQTGNFVIGFLASLAIMGIVFGMTAIRIPTGKRGGLENRSIGLFVVTVAGSMYGLSVTWRTSSLRRGLLPAHINAVLPSSSLKNCHVK